MRRVFASVALVASVVLASEALVAIGFRATLETFQVWVGVTSLLVLLAAVFMIFREPGPRLSDLQVGNYMVSSGTKTIANLGSPPDRGLDRRVALTALGTGLVLGGATLLMFLFL